jgi:hypothetical protein
MMPRILYDTYKKNKNNIKEHEKHEYRFFIRYLSIWKPKLHQIIEEEYHSINMGGR